MAVFHPAEQCLGFGDVAGVKAGSQGIEVIGRLACGLLHPRPIHAGDPHIAHAAFDVGVQCLQYRGIDDAIHLDVLKRFEAQFFPARGLSAFLERLQIARRVAGHRKNRVRQKMQRKRALGDDQSDRIDEKRHVVVDHLDDGVCRGVAVFAQRRIEHTDQGTTASAAGEQQLRGGDGGKLTRFAVREVQGCDIGIVGAQEELRQPPAQGTRQPRGGGRHGG